MSGAGDDAVSTAAFELRITANAEHLQLVRGFVHESAMCLGCSAPTTDEVVRATEEACQNVIRYAYGGSARRAITVTVGYSDTDLIVSVIDTAPPIDSRAQQSRPLDTTCPSGLGSHLIRACVDEVVVDHSPEGGNRLKLVKRIA